jgi:hypothetical protein
VKYWFGELSPLRNQLTRELAAVESGKWFNNPEIFQNLVDQIAEEL